MLFVEWFSGQAPPVAIRLRLRGGEALGLFNKRVQEARVDFALADSTPGEVYSRVEVGEEPFIADGRGALCLLVPIVTLRLIHDSKALRNPFVEGGASASDTLGEIIGGADSTTSLLDAAEAAEKLLESEEAARGFSFRWSDEQWASWDSKDSEELERMGFRFPNAFSEVLQRGVPLLVKELPLPATDHFRAELMRGRLPWAKIRGPFQHPEYFAPYAAMALIEHVARYAPYEDTVVPMAAALCVLNDLGVEIPIEELCTKGAVAALAQPIQHMALTEDPRGELARVRTAAKGTRDAG